MSVRYIPYQNKLAKLIRGAGGKQFADAVADADANLKANESGHLSELDAKIEEVRALCADPAAPGATSRIYDAANDAVALGGVCGLPQVSEAAYSLCELIDGTVPGRAPGAKAVRVHADALRLLRLGEALPEAERRQVLKGLREVVAREIRAIA
ncbi:MAG TPA: hypothetical protein VF559_06900 [Caulobacteraceae bacterium]